AAIGAVDDERANAALGHQLCGIREARRGLDGDDVAPLDVENGFDRHGEFLPTLDALRRLRGEGVNARLRITVPRPPAASARYRSGGRARRGAARDRTGRTAAGRR